MNSQLLNIERNVAHGKLYHALLGLRRYMHEQGDAHLRDNVERIETNYGYMLDYFASGGEDVQRDSLLHSMQRELLGLIDRMWVESKMRDSKFRQMMLHSGEAPKDDSVTERSKHLFNQVWGATLRGENFMPQQIDDDCLAVYVSALTLSLLFRFDRGQMLSLIGYATTSEREARLRAIVGLVLVLQKWNIRRGLYDEVEVCLSELLSDGRTSSLIATVCHLLIDTAMTGEAGQAMIDLQKQIEPKIKDSDSVKQIVIEVDEMDEDGPAWESTVGSAFRQHIDQMARLKEAGADLNYETIRAMLHERFFEENIANWFLPFREDNADLGLDVESENMKVLRGLMLKGMDLCDVDMYAMCLMYKRVGERMIESSGLPDAIREAGEVGDIEADKKETTDVCLMRAYIRSLYRFFNNNIWGVENDMAEATNIGSSLIFTEVLSPEERLKAATRLIEMDCLTEAEVVLLMLPSETEQQQKLGYICQQTGRTEDAVRYYERVLEQQEDAWTLRQVAKCLRRLGRRKVALQCYDRVLALREGDKSALQHKAQLLLELDRTQEALNVFYQLELLHSSDLNSSRGLGWCSFLMSNYEQAEQYLERVAYSTEARADDYLNYGHVLLLGGHRTEAIEMYAKCRNAVEKNSDFVRLFEKDRALMESKNISNELYTLIEEVIIRQVRNK